MKTSLILILLLGMITVANAHQKVVVVPLLEGGFSRPENILTVSASGGDYESVAEALEAITDASESNRYVIYVGPGTYLLSSTTNLKSYVSIIGSGNELTFFESKIRTPRSPMFSCSGQEFIQVSGIGLILSTSVTYSGNVGFSLNSCQLIKFNNIDITANTSSTGISGIAMGGSDLSLENSKVQIGSFSAGNLTGIFLETSNVNIVNTSVSARRYSGSTADSKAIFIGVGASFDMDMSMVNALGGVGIFMEDNDETFRHSIHNSKVSSIFSDKEQIHVSRSTLGQTLNSGAGLTCIFSDDGLGNELNSDCKLDAP